MITFTNLKWASFAHSTIYAALLASWAAGWQTGKTVFGFAHGIGWFVMSQKQNLEIPSVFAGIIVIMAIGLAFEGVFALIERRTVRRWGMLR